MKRSAMDHPKLMLLQHKLGVDKPAAVGILECLWHFTAHHTPDGRIGKYPPAVVALKIGHSGDPMALFQSLNECGWLDQTVDGWLIHDWADHCDDAVHLRLARAGLRFADGRMPGMARLNARERKAALARYQEQQRDVLAQGRGGFQPLSATARPQRAEGTRQDAASTLCAADPVADPPLHLCAHAVRPAIAEAEAIAEACASAEAETESALSVGSANTSADRSANEHHNISAARRTGNAPVSAAELLPQLLGAVQARQADLPARIVRATGEAAHYCDWWRQVTRLMQRHDGADALHEALRHVEDCANPAIRAAKDLGALRAPGAYLASRCRDHLARHGLRLPPPPKAAVA